MARRKSHTEIVFIPAPNKVLANIHKVPMRMWAKWNLNARWTFNQMMRQTLDSRVFSHPAYEVLPDDLWQTLRWNMAWNAAELAQEKTWHV